MLGSFLICFCLILIFSNRAIATVRQKQKEYCAQNLRKGFSQFMYIERLKNKYTHKPVESLRHELIQGKIQINIQANITLCFNDLQHIQAKIMLYFNDLQETKPKGLFFSSISMS